MFPLIPYKRLVIPTSLTIEKSVSLVSAAISQNRTISTWFASTKEFEGTVNEQGFKIQKVIHNRNSFLPVLYGRFISTDKGIKIEIHLTMDIFVIIFSAFWIAVVGGVFLLLAIGSITAGNLDENLWYPLAGIVFLYLMIFFGFGIYAKRTEEFIVNLFESYKIE